MTECKNLTFIDENFIQILVIAMKYENKLILTTFYEILKFADTENWENAL